MSFLSDYEEGIVDTWYMYHLEGWSDEDLGYMDKYDYDGPSRVPGEFEPWDMDYDKPEEKEDYPF